MKKLIVINGPPGVGKSTVSKELFNNLENASWLDGDWCWKIKPFVVNQENKNMVENNIIHLLDNYLNNSMIKYIIFSWVIPHDDLMEKIIKMIKYQEVEIHKISLICSENILEKRMLSDGRSAQRINDSVNRISSYHKMDTLTLDTSDLTISQTVRKIKEMIL